LIAKPHANLFVFYGCEPVGSAAKRHSGVLFSVSVPDKTAETCDYQFVVMDVIVLVTIIL
jgi:hypothetical protein